MPINSIIIENAVKNIAIQLELKAEIFLSDWKNLSENYLFKQLVICILSSCIKYEVALKYTERLCKGKCLESLMNQNLHENLIEEYLIKPINLNGKSVRYRFPKSKAKQLYQTASNLYSKQKGIKYILDSSPDKLIIRNRIIDSCSGIGLKQASMYLRNISFSSDVAILDTLLIDYLKLLGLLPFSYKCKTKNKYLNAEKVYLGYVNNLNQDIKYFDPAIWGTMKVYKRNSIWES